jgi:tetratricopeptide (TPR) repeat protein
LNDNLARQHQLQKTSQKKSGHQTSNDYRPFWLPASNYYALVLLVTIGFFFLLWAVFRESEEEETALIMSVIGAGSMLAIAVVIREILLRKARRRYLLAARHLDHQIKNIPSYAKLNEADKTKKLTLEKNAKIIQEIQKKSKAARVLGNVSTGHLEVFEICHDYLAATNKQMETIGVGSPRLAGIRRGREIVGELHRFHLMCWAEAESRVLTQKARNYVTISDKLNTAQEALAVLESALQFYPDEARLTESEAALKEFIVSIKVSHWIENAERAAFRGNYKRAINLYRDALFFLAREDVKSEEREAIAGKINLEIETLRGLSQDNKISK